MFSSVVGGGVEQILEMEMNEFILWHEAALLLPTNINGHKNKGLEY